MGLKDEGDSDGELLEAVVTDGDGVGALLVAALEHANDELAALEPQVDVLHEVEPPQPLKLSDGP